MVLDLGFGFGFGFVVWEGGNNMENLLCGGPVDPCLLRPSSEGIRGNKPAFFTHLLWASLVKHEFKKLMDLALLTPGQWDVGLSKED